MPCLHITAIPHTITSQLYSHFAFTGKVLRFAPMMRSCGYQIYHYGVEGSEPGADVSTRVAAAPNRIVPTATPRSRC